MNIHVNSLIFDCMQDFVCVHVFAMFLSSFWGIYSVFSLYCIFSFVYMYHVVK